MITTQQDRLQRPQRRTAEGREPDSSRVARPVDVAQLPLAPINPLPPARQRRAIRVFHTGIEDLRDAGGPVTRLDLVPKWLKLVTGGLFPDVVVASSPQAGRDILGRTDGSAERTVVHDQMRHLFGCNLFDLPNDRWIPRRRVLQPVFTKQRVREFAGHMVHAAEAVAGAWTDGTLVDLDAECRRLTLRALGRSVLGLNLDERAEEIAAPMRVALRYVANRSTRPVRAPRWLPTPARRRARAATADLRRLAYEVLQACRADPGRDAPLVHALIAARDPATGQGLSDDDICNELIVFMFAGHDTTATALAYAMWALGRHPDLQQRVAAEAAAIGSRELTSEDVPRLGYTVQVLHEALRLCPPAAATSRLALKDIEVDGYRVTAGTILSFGIYAVQRDLALWEHPLTFDPDRFSPAKSAGRDRWQYLPFGAGPRSCIGDHFAMLEATLALATIIRRAEIHSEKTDFPIAVPFTTIAAEPIPARMRPRDAEECGR